MPAARLWFHAPVLWFDGRRVPGVPLLWLPPFRTLAPLADGVAWAAAGQVVGG